MNLFSNHYKNLRSVIRNVYSEVWNIYSEVRNVHSVLRNINFPKAKIQFYSITCKISAIYLDFSVGI